MGIGDTYEPQTIGVPLAEGSRVTLLGSVDIDADGGVAADIIFEGYVEQYVPNTGLLSFEDSDVGYSEFQTMMEEANGIEIIRA